MTGRAYYLTTFGALQRHAARLTTSHWVALSPASAAIPAIPEAVVEKEPPAAAPSETTPILALIEADEGAHLALEDDAGFQALPNPLAQRPISPAAQAALASYGVAPGATTFDAAEVLARVHPLLRHRVF
ncbi:MAG: hypothetical protein WA192_02445 [Candidatus Acidiferrales bacterium]